LRLFREVSFSFAQGVLLFFAILEHLNPVKYIQKCFKKYQQVPLKITHDFWIYFRAFKSGPNSCNNNIVGRYLRPDDNIFEYNID